MTPNSGKKPITGVGEWKLSVLPDRGLTSEALVSIDKGPRVPIPSKQH